MFIGREYYPLPSIAYQDFAGTEPDVGDWAQAHGVGWQALHRILALLLEDWKDGRSYI